LTQQIQTLPTIQEETQTLPQQQTQQIQQNQTIPLTRTISRSTIPINDVGFYSQPKPEPVIELPLNDSQNEDELLADEFNHKLQEKILDLELIDEII